MAKINANQIDDIPQSQVTNLTTDLGGKQDVLAEGAFVDGDKTKLDGIETGAEVNNISDVNATDLTDGGDSTLHYHATDRARANHTGTQTASTISDFDTGVSNNTDVAANTAARHSAVTVTDSSEIDFTLTGQNITASLVAGSIDETKLDTSTNASLDLADSSVQPGDNVSDLTNDAGYLASVTASDIDSEAATDGYVLTADGAGNSAWEAVSGGGGGMTSFSLAGDTGTPQTISDGNTLTVAGGTGIDTSAGATDTATIALDSATQASLSLADSATQPGDNVSTLTNDAGYTTNTGDVVGPSSSIDNTVAIFDSTTGKLLKSTGGASSPELVYGGSYLGQLSPKQPASGSGSNFRLYASDAGDATSSGGYAYLSAGSGGATSGNGGHVTVSGGGASGASTGGRVSVYGGASNSGSGGSIYIYGGNSTSGSDGNVELGNPGHVLIQKDGDNTALGLLSMDSISTATTRTFTFPDSSGTVALTSSSITGNAATATALQTARTFRTNLASTSTASFNGTANVTPGVTGNLPVTNGGTGRATSTTAYGLIAAGTTATGAHQTLATGTSGQILKSNGSGALPTFQTGTGADVGLGNVDNTSDATKNSATATLTNKTISGSSNTITNIGPSSLATGATSATVATSQTTTSTSYTDLATTGPTATVTIGSNGLALVTVTAELSNNTVNSYAAMSFALSGANTVAASTAKALYLKADVANNSTRMSYTTLLTGLSSGSTTFTAKYAVIVGGTATFANREISVIPL